jgi:hypothetical protein
LSFKNRCGSFKFKYVLHAKVGAALSSRGGGLYGAWALIVVRWRSSDGPANE